MGYRQKRVNSIIIETVSEIIEYDLKDPRLGLITVTSSEISPDLKRATIYFTVHGGEEEGKKNAELLNSASGFIQHQLSEKLELKYTPKIKFKYDPVYDKIERIETLLKEEKDEKSN